MTHPTEVLSPVETAKALGVSVKALRLYERHGLIVPVRTAAGWRTYGPAEIARAAEIVALRAMGLSLAQVGQALASSGSRHGVLAAHAATLDGERRRLDDVIARVRATVLRSPSTDRHDGPKVQIKLTLPWPWAGETFELPALPAVTYIIGPLGSGKTRLAQAMAASLPGAAFIGLERLADDGAQARARLRTYRSLRARVDATLSRLVARGAVATGALIALLTALESEGPKSDRTSVLVVDMIEQGLCHATQAALAADLRNRDANAPPLIVLTRSTAILDLAAVGPDASIVLCPANHSPPTVVQPYPGAPGYEAVATCLASPEVRARTEGVIAWRPKVA